MIERLKSRLRAARDTAQWPVTSRLDLLRDELRALDERLTARLDELERMAQSTGMRASGAAEEISQVVESTARVGQRIAEVERLLGSNAGER